MSEVERQAREFKARIKGLDVCDQVTAMSFLLGFLEGKVGRDCLEGMNQVEYLDEEQLSIVREAEAAAMRFVKEMIDGE